MSQRTGLVVNGAEVLLATPPGAPLLSALREELGLRGARSGCGIGECGSCTVLVDGAPTRSCITPVSSAAGSHVTTPEGLGTPDCPSPVQKAFLDEQAGQCGFCINGMIMRLESLRAEGTTDRAAVTAALEEHLCRCGTHVRVLRAAERALCGDPSATPPRAEADRVVAQPRAPEARARVEVPVGSPVERRLRLLDDGQVEVLAGKAELGQGIFTACAQIVAAQLGLPSDRVVVRSPSTACGPDDGYTSGSGSLEDSGVPLAATAVAFRRLLLERAGALLGAAPEDLRWEGSRVVAGGAAVTLAQLAAGGDVVGLVDGCDVPDWDALPLGATVPRTDLPAKLTGAPAFVHDLALPGMVHARVLLPPTYLAELVECDLEVAREVPGVVEVIRDGSFVLVVAERSFQAVTAVTRLSGTARWADPGLGPLGTDWLRGPVTDTHAPRTDPVPALEDPAARVLRATYSKPYEAHAPIAPSCAVAVVEGGRLTVWTHSQGVHPLRQELSALLGRDAATVTVEHRDGPGCYGHNFADDAAAFAAVAAERLGGRPVRFQFSVRDEFSWEPYGSAMEAQLAASLDGSGSITAWRHLARTDLHHARPDGSGDRLVPAWLRERGTLRPRPLMGDPGSRNAVPLYDLPALHVRADFVQGPLRTSSLRSLGAYLNVFASESFMDELAEAAGADPLAFRLRHLSDPRARTLLELAAERAGWEPHVGPSGKGQGLAVCRYKNIRAYVALVLDLRVDTERGDITVTRVVVACDAGGVVNPDGLRNQLEGGVIQGLSRALHERVTFDGRGIQSLDWTSYPVLRFSAVPEIDVTLVDRRGEPPLGAGESSTPPLPAALGNALDDAVGIRVRDLPITPARLQQRLMDMSPDEASRVLL